MADDVKSPRPAAAPTSSLTGSTPPAREDLRAREAKHRALFEAESDAVFLIDNATGRILEANEAATTLYGYPRDALLQLKDTDLSAEPEDTQRVTSTTAISPDATVRIPFRRDRRKDGTAFSVEITGRFFEWQGRPVHLAAMRDITARMQTEQALRASEERYRRLTEAVTDYIYSVRIDAGQAVETRHGPGCVAVTGYTSEEFAADPHLWFRMVLPEDRPRVEDHARRLAAGEEVGPLEHRLARKDGALRWVRNTPVAHRNAEGRLLGYDGLIQDITGQKRAEADLAERTRQLEAVRAVSAEITQELDLATVLRLVAERACELTTAAAADIDLWDDDRQLLVPQATYGHSAPRPKITRRLGEGAIGTVAQTRQGMILNSYRSSPLAHPHTLVHTKITASLIEPLLYRDRLLGVIGVDHETPGRTFTDHDQATLRLFATQAAIAIENARLHEAVVRRSGQLEALLSATRSLMSGVDLQGILDRIVAQAAEISGAPHVKVLLVDEQAKGLRVGAILGGEHAAGDLLPLDQGASGIVTRTGEPLFVPDHLHDPRNLYAAQDGEYGLVTYLGLPIKQGDRVLGVLTFNTRLPREYSVEEIAYLAAFAGQAAIAIENARLFRDEQARRAQLEAVRKVSAEITQELDLPTLLALIHRHATELLGTGKGTVFLWDEADQVLVPRVWRGYGDQTRELRLKLGEGVAGTVAQRREGLIVNDFRTSPHITPMLLARTTHIGVVAEPLLYRGQLLGVVSVDNTDPGRRFTEQDRETLALLAAQAAIAIENARLHEAAVRRNAELEALLRASRAVLAGLDLDAVLRRIVDEAVRISQCAHVKLMLLDKDANALRVAALSGTALPGGLQFPLGDSLSGIVASTKQPFFSSDPSHDTCNILQGADRADGIATYLGLPILIHGEVAGVLTFNTTAPKTYSSDELAYLTAFADQAAIAIENARLFRDEQTRRAQIEAVRAVSAEIARELDLPRLLRVIAERAKTLFHQGTVGIFLWDAEAGLLRAAAYHVGDDPVVGGFRRLGEGVVGIVAERRAGILANAYPTAPYALPAVVAAGISAVVAEPLLYQDRLLGVIGIDNRHTKTRFTAQDQEALRLVATQAAIAIENARLFSATQQALADLRRAQAEMVRTEQLRGLGQMAAGIAHDLNNMLATVLGQTELAKLANPPTTLREILGLIETAAADGAAVVHRLQEFARPKGTSPLTPCDLGGLVQEVVEFTRPRWQDELQRRGRVIGMEVSIGSALPLILGRPPELREALTNLIFNAVDAMPQGGTLTLAARVSEGSGDRPTGRREASAPVGAAADSPGLPLPLSPPQSCVELTVTDTGIGMPAEVQAKLFEPFFTTKGVKGTGLGLAVVYGIMERHGGTIAVASTPGQGTTFTLTFQQAPEPPATVPAPAPPAPAAPARRLLVVDDDPLVRQTLVALLRAAGHTVSEAADGPTALAFLIQTAVDAVLTDLGMPGMSGWELAGAIKERDPHLPVLLLTGWQEQMPEDETNRRHVDAILGKPVRLKALREALAKLTRARRPSAPG